MNVLVAGAGGFIGGHLVKRLTGDGHHVLAVDIKPLGEWWQVQPKALNWPEFDLRSPGLARRACSHIDEIYNLAADMGGIGFITGNKLDCMMSVEMSLNLLRAAAENQCQRFFYASSACVYPQRLQDTADVQSLRESDAYPADPEDGYGWEKLFSERLCRHFTEDTGLETRVARYHNVFGPHGTWVGGREKAPAAICRKIAEAKVGRRAETPTVEVWGDGGQSRSFLYVDDAIEGTLRLMRSMYHDPVNIGSDHLVTIDHLVDLTESVAHASFRRVYVSGAPQGVRGRCSENTLCRKVLGWEPQVALADGLALTYPWIEERVIESLQSGADSDPACKGDYPLQVPVAPRSIAERRGARP